MRGGCGIDRLSTDYWIQTDKHENIVGRGSYLEMLIGLIFSLNFIESNPIIG